MEGAERLGAPKESIANATEPLTLAPLPRHFFGVPDRLQEGHRASSTEPSYEKPLGASRMVALLLLGALASVSACQGSRSAEKEVRSVSGIAEDRELALKLRELRAEYFSRPREARGELSAKLVELIQAYPTDPATDWVRCYLALNKISGGDPKGGTLLAQEVRGRSEGRLRDLAAVALASGRSTEGKPEQALELLLPLLGKVIETDERNLFYEELTRAGVQAKRYRQAMTWAYNWVTRSELTLPEASDLRIQGLLNRVPTIDLKSSLITLSEEPVAATLGTKRAALRAWFLRMLRQTLLTRALEEEDGELAQWLLGATTQKDRSQEVSLKLSRLAASGGPTAVRVIGRRLGFVVASGNDEARSRSASALSGVLSVLDLTSDRLDQDVELSLETDDGTPGAARRALEALSGNGAALLIAGFDPESSTLAVQYAAQESIPVLLIEPASRSSISRFVFDVGEPFENVLAELGKAAATLQRVVRVGDGFTSCGLQAAGDSLYRYPVSDWQRTGIQAVMLLGDGLCSNVVTSELRSVGFGPQLFLGLESAHRADAYARFRRTALSAGAFPSETGAQPWYQVLGRDAALLASRALKALPADRRAEDRDQSRQLHALAQKALAAAEADLLSTDRRGFAGSQRLERTLTLIERAKGVVAPRVVPAKATVPPTVPSAPERQVP